MNAQITSKIINNVILSFVGVHTVLFIREYA